MIAKRKRDSVDGDVEDYVKSKRVIHDGFQSLSLSENGWRNDSEMTSNSGVVSDDLFRQDSKESVSSIHQNLNIYSKDFSVGRPLSRNNSVDSDASSNDGDMSERRSHRNPVEQEVLTRMMKGGRHQYVRKVDYLVDEIIRKKAQRTGFSQSYEEGSIPSSIGPHPATDHALSLLIPYTPPSLPIPSTSSSTYSSKSNYRPNPPTPLPPRTTTITSTLPDNTKRSWKSSETTHSDWEIEELYPFTNDHYTTPTPYGAHTNRSNSNSSSDSSPSSENNHPLSPTSLLACQYDSHSSPSSSSSTHSAASSTSSLSIDHHTKPLPHHILPGDANHNNSSSSIDSIMHGCDDYSSVDSMATQHSTYTNNLLYHQQQQVPDTTGRSRGGSDQDGYDDSHAFHTSNSPTMDDLSSENEGTNHHPMHMEIVREEEMMQFPIAAQRYRYMHMHNNNNNNQNNHSNNSQQDVRPQSTSSSSSQHNHIPHVPYTSSSGLTAAATAGMKNDDDVEDVGVF